MWTPHVQYGSVRVYCSPQCGLQYTLTVFLRLQVRELRTHKHIVHIISTIPPDIDERALKPSLDADTVDGFANESEAAVQI